MAEFVTGPATWAQTEDTLGHELANALGHAAQLDAGEPGRIVASALMELEPEVREQVLGELRAAACVCLNVDYLSEIDEV